MRSGEFPRLLEGPVVAGSSASLDDCYTHDTGYSSAPLYSRCRPKADGRFFFKADEQADERYATRLRAFETVLSRVWQSRKA
jgi:hypothetical protein